MERYAVNYRMNGKMRHWEHSDFPSAKNTAVSMRNDGRYEDVRVIAASFDDNDKLHQVVYNF